MIKTLTRLLAFTAIIFLTGLGCSRHSTVAKPTGDTSFVPFTKALKRQIESNQLDLKKIQFFVDQKLILRRSLGTQKSAIKSGVIFFEKGQYVNEVIIPRNTPGVCETMSGDHLMVSFELENNNIEFGPGGMNGDFFTLYARNWTGGTADITYDNKNYKLQCATCYNAGDVRLLVRKTEADKLQRTQRVVTGRKVDN